MVMSPKKIAHIGIAVKSIAEALPFYQDQLGLILEEIETVPSEQVKVAFLRIGETRLELLESLSEEGPIAKFIAKKGEGIHHIALEVEDLEERLNQLKAAGVPLINQRPKQGAGGAQIAFIHPKSTRGILMELCQYADQTEGE